MTFWGGIGEQARPMHLGFLSITSRKRDCGCAVSGSKEPIREGSLCKMLSDAISSISRVLTIRPWPNRCVSLK